MPAALFVHGDAMKVHDIMSANVRCIASDTNLLDAAKIMRDLGVGVLPICDHGRLAGMLTDRDIVMKGLANHRDPQRTSARDAMTEGVVYIYDDHETEEAALIFQARQIRRLPVLNRTKRTVGIVSLGDLAIKSEAGLNGEILKEISFQSASEAT